MHKTRCQSDRCRNIHNLGHKATKVRHMDETLHGPALKDIRRLWFWDKQYSKTHKQDLMALILNNIKQWNFIHLFMANVFRSKTKLRMDEGYLPKEILKSKVMAQNHKSASVISLPYFTNCMFNCLPCSNDYASVLDIIVHAIKLKRWPDYSRGG